MWRDLSRDAFAGVPSSSRSLLIAYDKLIISGPVATQATIPH
jgi:hypothetical protein